MQLAELEPRPNRPLPIRITPLIDVVFILLVFFMLTTRLMPVDYLELGNDTASRSSVTGMPLPELQVMASGEVLWNGQGYALNELLPALQTAGIREANLSTTPETRLSDFTRTLSALSTAGVEPHWNRDSSTDL
ncbi:MAG TPA: biopolymer transporter ExbD [Marinobacter sp.]|nr:biopolymer transporter ExbD [Marinobacter sp.]